MFNKVDYTMITVSDMKRSVKFYKEVLGLKLKLETEGWSEFENGTTVLALHGGGAPAQQGQRGGQPTAGTCSIGFSVENLEKTVADLKAKQVQFVMPVTVREQEGIKLAVAIDPDGLPISFAEPLKVAK